MTLQSHYESECPGMKVVLSLLAFVAWTTDLLAADRLFKTIDGKTYKGEITNVEPDGLTISHEDGISKIVFTRFAEDVQTEFGYDAAKAEAYRRSAVKSAAEHKAFQADLAKRVATAQPAATPVPAAAPQAAQPQAGARSVMSSGKGATTSKGLSIGNLKK